MSACSQTQRAIAQAVSLSALDEAHAAHAATCAQCGALLDRYRQLDRVTRRTRRVLETEGELSPNDWVRIREGIDRGIADRRPWLRTALVTAAAAAAIVVAFAIVQGGQGSDVGRASALALDEVSQPTAPQVAIVQPAPAPDLAPAPEILAAAEGGVGLTVASGDVLEAGDAARTIDAFGRHHVTIAADSAVRVIDWRSDKLALEVVSGEVTCDVNRAQGEDVFEVRSGDVTVRVLGTIFTVARDDAGATRVAVSRGRVGVIEGTGAMREIAAGESVEIAATTAQAERDAVVEPRVRRAPRGQRVIQIDVPDQQMDGSAAEVAWTSSLAYQAIVSAIDAGNCEAAMKALDAAVEASRRSPIPAGAVTKLRARCR